MIPHPYRVVCQSRTTTTLSYLSEWYATPAEAQQAQAQHCQEGTWQQVDLVAPGAIPAASITGRQVLAVGGVNLPPRRGA